MNINLLNCQRNSSVSAILPPLLNPLSQLLTSMFSQIMASRPPLRHKTSSVNSNGTQCCKKPYLHTSIGLIYYQWMALLLKGPALISMYHTWLIFKLHCIHKYAHTYIYTRILKNFEFKREVGIDHCYKKKGNKCSI